MAEQEDVVDGEGDKSKMTLMSLNDTKAGMTGLDKDKINAVIEEASKGSKFYAAKAKRQAKIEEQKRKMRENADKIPVEDLRKTEFEIDDKIIPELRSNLDMTRTIVHVDMDMFYAAVEMRDDPSLKSKPMAVGGMGMLSTSNYQARKFGVRAGMPGFIGKKLCPELILVKPNFTKYKAASSIVRKVFEEYDPGFRMMSLDEGYLDITDYLARNPDQNPETAVDELRNKIKIGTDGLTASAGIAPNTMLAKIASDMNKPDGQFVIRPDVKEIERFMADLPIRKVSGIGNVTEQMLGSVEIEKCKDLYSQRAKLKILFSEISFNYFIRIALGIGSTVIKDDGEDSSGRKSMSTETTFRDTSDKAALMETCSKLCFDLSEDLQKKGLKGRSVTLKIKSHDFQVKTKVMSLLEITDDPAVMEEAAKKLLRFFMETWEEKPLKLRLMGVKMSDFDESYKNSGQKKIENYFSSSASNNKNSTRKEKFLCPICAKEVWVENEQKFNEHLDVCLIKADKEDEEDITGDSKTSKDKGKVIKLSPQKEDKKEDAQICPICSKELPFKDLALVNKHVDDCLAQPSAAKRPKMDKKEGIKAYFKATATKS